MIRFHDMSLSEEVGLAVIQIWCFDHVWIEIHEMGLGLAPAQTNIHPDSPFWSSLQLANFTESDPTDDVLRIRNGLNSPPCNTALLDGITNLNTLPPAARPTVGLQRLSCLPSQAQAA